ncbi:unnamed protein product [Adineta ricciae]|uniref:GH84 domain-containing protein n=1 Tax=Adineta ricciae TaxID=249248 RepID=A0A815GL17_ADIRI|nr:unnamed protein product [Adineta ricciae]CAF1438250.1 unnamed protein product [Adineta ricciae]
MSVPSTNPINGLIEGFYWSASNAVNNEYDFFTKKQRDQLVSSMNEGVNYYFYCPQDREDDSFTMRPWNTQKLIDWSDTISRASNISFVIGLRPRWIDTVQSSFESIKLILNQLASIGIRYYILCWDDASGAGTDSQMILQRDLIHALVREVTNIELIGIIPAFYARSQVADATNVVWAEKLSILNQISSKIRFFVTGLTVVPSSIQITDIPPLENRQFIFFDNWIAVDSNSKVTMTWPPNRHPDIYKGSQSVSGSVLNLAFPPERIIHQIYALKQRINNTYSNINANQAAESWATYLISNTFYESNAFERLQSDLQSLIDHGYETNSEILQHYPLLKRIFTN